ncbi:LADA_0H19856g1_1 [Lachancea dasiensis]|uniref:Probable quinone oxidoreductase n=1 Tax=Lachancea dasiensis TaxID=1072105 RepID=A0A1G4K6I1_9SACH|nr:LADA_0H19856g1_1 [Lachancea dasiensis]
MLRPTISAVRKMATNAAATAIPSTHKAVFIRETGGLEVLRYEDYPVPKVGDNDILVKNKYAGVNFIESYFRKGIYPSEKPYVLGREATGIVVAKGQNVTKFDLNDKVAYICAGTLAQYTSVNEHGKIVRLPESTSEEKLKLYAASLIQVMTAVTFVREAYTIQKGDFALLYAAAGGAGLAFNQVLKSAGARVIAVASTGAKLQLAQEYGAEFLINSSTDDILAKVLEYTNGEGVSVAYDSVGKDTFDTTLAAVKRKGTIVSFGNASGSVDPLHIGRLTPKNVKLLRPSLLGYLGSEEEWDFYSRQLIELVDGGKVKVLISKVYPLSEYKQATTALEARKTVGKLLIEI